jgi:hypothetical protein
MFDIIGTKFIKKSLECVVFLQIDSKNAFFITFSNKNGFFTFWLNAYGIGLNEKRIIRTVSKYDLITLNILMNFGLKNLH